jgi:hypothetical protein
MRILFALAIGITVGLSNPCGPRRLASPSSLRVAAAALSGQHLRVPLPRRLGELRSRFGQAPPGDEPSGTLR